MPGGAPCMNLQVGDIVFGIDRDGKKIRFEVTSVFPDIRRIVVRKNTRTKTGKSIWKQYSFKEDEVEKASNGRK
jgi:hypothetical protein